MKKKINRRSNKKGFTLIELVLVIAILGILASLVIPRAYAFKVQLEENKFKSDLRTLQTATFFAIEEGLIKPNSLPGNAAKQISKKTGIPYAYVDSTRYVLKGIDIPSGKNTRIGVIENVGVYLNADHVLKSTAEKIAADLGYPMPTEPGVIPRNIYIHYSGDPKHKDEKRHLRILLHEF